MPKVDVIPYLQEQVRSHVEVMSACELGRLADLHRSTVLRFCKTGRATSATVQKLTKAMAALSSTSEIDGEDAVCSVPGDTATQAHHIPQELMSLRTMLQTLISLIDGQYGRMDLPVERTATSAQCRPASQ